MGWWDRMLGRGNATESRMITSVPGLERPNADVLQVLGIGDVPLPAVTIESALQVPAVLAAATFLPRTLASLPLHAYRTTRAGPQKIESGRLRVIIHDAPNEEWTSYGLRQWFWTQVFTAGRGLLWIERNGRDPVALWPVTGAVSIKRDVQGRTTYRQDSSGRTFESREIIDIPFMLKQDGLGHWGPIERGARAIQLALAMNQYGSRFFAGGGVPPLALIGPLPQNGQNLKRAMDEVHNAINAAKESDKPVFPLPPGHELKPVGFDPEKGQMTDARRFQIEEIARIYQLPPVFLMDLSRATFSNAEQQDLHLVKHLIGQWAEAFEQELNLKLFGQMNAGRYIRHNLDGLMRGDFKTRMEGLARAVQSSIYTPDEARALEGRQAQGGNAEKLFMQSGTVPIDTMTDAGDVPPTDGGSANGN